MKFKLLFFVKHRIKYAITGKNMKAKNPNSPQSKINFIIFFNAKRAIKKILYFLIVVQYRM